MYSNNDNSNGPLKPPVEKPEEELVPVEEAKPQEENTEQVEQGLSAGHAINVPHENIMESTRSSDNYRQVDDIKRDFAPDDKLEKPKETNVGGKRKGIIYVVIIFVIGLTAIGVIQIFDPFGTGKQVKDAKERLENNPRYKIVVNNYSISKDYNGYFKGDNFTLYLYALNDKELYFYYRSKTDTTSGIAKLLNSRQSATYNKNDVYFSFTFTKENKIQVSSTNYEIDKVSLEREENITKEKCLSLEYGLSKIYSDSKYNYKYKSELYTLTMYQTKDDEVRVFIYNNGVVSNIDLTIESDGSLKTPTYYESIHQEKMTINFDNNKINVKHTNSKGTEITGEYEKGDSVDADTLLTKNFK